jgi:hypothetical protein
MPAVVPPHKNCQDGSDCEGFEEVHPGEAGEQQKSDCESDPDGYRQEPSSRAPTEAPRGHLFVGRTRSHPHCDRLPLAHRGSHWYPKPPVEQHFVGNAVYQRGST